MTPAVLDPPEAAAPACPAGWVAAAPLVALLVLLAANLPAFLRTGLDCDPLVFDLYVRDAGRGRVLYRDVLENNTPAMIALHAAVRGVAGWSSEALRAADLLVMGAAVWLLAGWGNRGRPDRRLVAAAVLGACYLSSTEWCHCQRDGWVLLPVLLAMRLRLRRVERWGRTPACPNSGQAGVLPHQLLEGVVWGLAVWLKPHLLLVAAAVWLAGLGHARGRGAGRDLVAVVAGGLLAGAAGVGAMWAAGVWRPYLAHLTTWAGEYPGADLYGPFGRGLCLLGAGLRNLPWSLLYVLALPAAAWALARRTGPERSLPAAALLAWAGQAFFLQHVFDYVHLPAVLLALALLLHLATGRAWPTLVLLLAAAWGHAPVLVDRLAAWPACFGPATPALRDRLARFDRLPWGHLDAVAGFLRAAGCRDGELSALSDTALPLYTLTGLAPPTRYYTPRNALLAYRSRRPEILAALAGVPGQRFAVVDLRTLRWTPPADADAGPLPAGWGRWADRVAFRSGRLVVLAIPAADVPALLADVAEF